MCKRIWSALFAVSTMLCSCQNRSGDILFQPVDPLQKILPEQQLFMPVQAIAHVARGECATFQFVVRSSACIEGLQATMTPFVDSLVRPTSSLSNQKISFVGQVHEGRAQVDPGSDCLVSPSGFYPDPLLDDTKTDVGPNLSVGIWVSVPVPKTITPGIYRSTITITGQVNGSSFKRTLPIGVKIYSAVINQQTLMLANWHQSSFRYVDGEEIPYFTPRWWELMGQLADLMGEYRQNVVQLSPLLLAQYSFDEQGEVTEINFDRFDEVVQLFQQKGILKRLAGAHIAKRLGDWESPFGYLVPKNENGQTVFTTEVCESKRAKEFFGRFLLALYAHLEEKGWQDMYMQHIADEPIAENKDSYRAIASFVKSQIPNIRIIDACLTHEVSNQVDVQVAQLDKLQEDTIFYQNQQKQGKEVWFYTCVWPQGEYANRYIRQPLLKTRLLHWINYRYRITGYLHWGLNFWRGENPLLETAAIQSNGTVLPAGDAWIVYPYKNHIIPSIRMEAMRDGVNDYELLRLLEQQDPAAAKKIIDSIIFGFQMYDMDVAHFRRTRIKLLEALEENRPYR